MYIKKKIEIQFNNRNIYIIYYNVFHSSFWVLKYIVASLFGPLEMAMAAVLPGETNHSEVEANLLMGVLREERRDSKGLGWKKKGRINREREKKRHADRAGVAGQLNMAIAVGCGACACATSILAGGTGTMDRTGQRREGTGRQAEGSTSTRHTFVWCALSSRDKLPVSLENLFVDVCLLARSYKAFSRFH